MKRRTWADSLVAAQIKLDFGGRERVLYGNPAKMEKECAGQNRRLTEGNKPAWGKGRILFDRIPAGYYNFLKLSYWGPDE